ncbi:hypothetical protein K435DRAFT_881356 [Dendrothele bispora CBS 962.96]|uniref:Uncharacterized protein n=1 Tax=Dendrothele bispora (strain CBS 962.96) TaxID=1314807 RepID=A0A4S8KIF2_DENBC|nr:hypothetical protein K435DRAFT_881356 [Dendrothele bispora CBS 962.96]
MSDTWAILDDTDSRIVYQGDWQIGGRNVEYNGTTHGLKGTADSSASLDFTGTQVKIFATLDSRKPKNPNPIVDINLDGSLALRYAPDLSSTIQYQQSIFSSSILNEGNHTLSISSGINTSNAIWLDYFEYLPSNTSTPAPFPTSSLTSGQASGHPPQKSLTVGGIIGIILGVVFLLGVVLAVVFLLWKRKKNRVRHLKQYRDSHSGEH